MPPRQHTASPAGGQGAFNLVSLSCPAPSRPKHKNPAGPGFRPRVHVALLLKPSVVTSPTRRALLHAGSPRLPFRSWFHLTCETRPHGLHSTLRVASIEPEAATNARGRSKRSLRDPSPAIRVPRPSFATRNLRGRRAEVDLNVYTGTRPRASARVRGCTPFLPVAGRAPLDVRDWVIGCRPRHARGSQGRGRGARSAMPAAPAERVECRVVGRGPRGPRRRWPARVLGRH